MDLKTYLSERVPADKRKEFADRCGTSWGHLVNVSNGKTCGPKLAAALERETALVTRKDMRPEDYWLIWPDLPPPTPAKQTKRVALARA